MPPHRIESPHPNAVESALLRGLEEQNNALQTHVAWLSAELARVSADEQTARENLSLLSSRMNPLSAVSLHEVRSLQDRVGKLSDAAAAQSARAHAAELAVSSLQVNIAKRESQVLQLSMQIGLLAAHVKDQANAVAGWSERHPTNAQVLSTDLTTAKFEMQQRLIASLTQQLAEANFELGGCRVATNVWEARHMMWEQAIASNARAGVAPRRNSSANWRRADDESAEDTSSTTKATISLAEAERAWQERCEQLRRREASS
jgi:hypothetical protein